MYKKSLTNLTKLPRQEVRDFLCSLELILTDCDGVLWLATNVIEGAPRVMNRFREMGKRVFFVTNNSTRNRERMAAKACAMGFYSTMEDFINTSYMTANYLKSLHFDKKVYLIGSEALSTELDIAGIKHTKPGPDIFSVPMKDWIRSYTPDPDIAAVVVGFDWHLSYLKIFKATDYLKDPNVHFIATNKDSKLQWKHKFTIPGAGTAVTAVETVAGRRPFVVGKPGQYAFEIIKRFVKITPAKTLFIGDRCDTDILMGAKSGLQTLLVLTGVQTLEEAQEFKKSKNPNDHELVPDYYVNTISDLMQFLE